MEGDYNLLVDTGAAPKSLMRIRDERGVDVVLATHYHTDHMSGNHIFPNARFFAHELDAPIVGSMEEFEKAANVKGAEEAREWRKRVTEQRHWSPGNVTRILKDAEEIDLGSATIRVVHTPGHTPGHLCLHFLEEDALFLTDIDLTDFGPWYANNSSSIEDFVDSIEKIRKIKAKVYITSHEAGVIWGDIDEKLIVFRDKIFERDNKILEILKEPMNPVELSIIGIIYQGPIDKDKRPFRAERNMVKKHLERLLKHGKIEKIDGDRYRTV